MTQMLQLEDRDGLLDLEGHYFEFVVVVPHLIRLQEDVEKVTFTLFVVGHGDAVDEVVPDFEVLDPNMRVGVVCFGFIEDHYVHEIGFAVDQYGYIISTLLNDLRAQVVSVEVGPALPDFEVPLIILVEESDVKDAVGGEGQEFDVVLLGLSPESDIVKGQQGVFLHLDFLGVGESEFLEQKEVFDDDQRRVDDVKEQGDAVEVFQVVDVEVAEGLVFRLLLKHSDDLDFLYFDGVLLDLEVDHAQGVRKVTVGVEEVDNSFDLNDLDLLHVLHVVDERLVELDVNQLEVRDIQQLVESVSAHEAGGKHMFIVVVDVDWLYKGALGVETLVVDFVIEDLEVVVQDDGLLVFLEVLDLVTFEQRNFLHLNDFDLHEFFAVLHFNAGILTHDLKHRSLDREVLGLEFDSELLIFCVEDVDGPDIDLEGVLSGDGGEGNFGLGSIEKVLQFLLFGFDQDLVAMEIDSEHRGL